ncbi:MAG: glutamate-5-semialdehyde dehydrogenase [Planctomycetota bacterium]|nr:glutamate-5-semialdehyde dehydrogenase [Planctomycetota bacterium]
MTASVEPENGRIAETELSVYCEQIAQQAKVASRQLTSLEGQRIDDWLRKSASQLEEQVDRICEANRTDIARSGELGLSDAQVDRLRLDPQRVSGIADGMRNIANLDSPVGEIFESSLRPNGLLVNKVRVPLGVIFFIYESRPNVTADAAAIAIKSRNAIILRGGKEAASSSQAVVEILQESARTFAIPENAIQLVATADRDAVDHFLCLNQYIDLTIPRGGEALIRRVSEQATMPVIKHFSGNCHVYVDQFADPGKAMDIVINSKCHRLGVCNAAESLLVHQQVAPQLLPDLLKRLGEQGIRILGDEEVCRLDSRAEPASEEDFRAEFLDAILSVAVVPSVQAAIDHINRYGSGHTDCIVSENTLAISQFTRQVDSAAVMVNASTRFNDGGEFGLGAEIGISTDKFHARGPCGLKELTTYKFICVGQGQTR